MLHWFLHLIGADNTSGLSYGFWSGFGSDIGEFALIAGMVAAYRKHNCHVKGCWRLGKHPVEGTPYITCKKHHPTIHVGTITAQHVKTEHNLHLSSETHQADLLKEVHEQVLSDPEEES